MTSSKEDILAIMYAEFYQVMVLKASVLKTLDTGNCLLKTYKTSMFCTLLTILIFVVCGFMARGITLFVIGISIMLATHIMRLFNTAGKYLEASKHVSSRKELLFLISIREAMQEEYNASRNAKNH